MDCQTHLNHAWNTWKAIIRSDFLKSLTKFLQVEKKKKKNDDFVVLSKLK